MSHTNAARTTTMVTRSLGSNGPTVSMIGLGCMGMSGAYGERDDDESVATIRAATESGITLLDTGDFYGMGHNEMLIRRALDGFDRALQLSVKFGVLRGPDGSWGGIDTRPEAMRTFLAYSLQRPGTDNIDITDLPGSTQTSRSPRRLGQSARWSPPDTCATSGCLRSVRKRSVPPPPPIHR
jgi:aryl-alcohol dehydrogenase-like predicted oxidoreductase